MITLGIETSCDETSFSIVQDGKKVLSNVVFTSLEQHQPYGGVIPEIASRSHLEALTPCLDEALKKSKKKLSDISLIAVTQGPGLLGSLLVGVSAAKALSLTLKKPLVGVDHVIAHLHAGMLADPTLRYPWLGLVVSGGHTILVRVRSASAYDILGKTMDDAAGEAFDKVAKILGLGYPGGPVIDRLSKNEDPEKFFFTRPYLSQDSLDFSFSGIKTAVFYTVERLKKKKKITSKDKKAIAAGFQEAVCETLVKKAVRAAQANHLKSIVVGGGVSANTRLKQMMIASAKAEGLKVVFPSLALCQDNAAMIAALGTELYREGKEDTLDLKAYPEFLYGNQARRV